MQRMLDRLQAAPEDYLHNKNAPADHTQSTGHVLDHSGNTVRGTRDAPGTSPCLRTPSTPASHTEHTLVHASVPRLHGNQREHAQSHCSGSRSL